MNNNLKFTTARKKKSFMFSLLNTIFLVIKNDQKLKLSLYVCVAEWLFFAYQIFYLLPSCIF